MSSLSFRGVLARALPSLLFPVLLLQCHEAHSEVQDPDHALSSELLIDYVRIDTSNPPGGNTRAAAELLRDFLTEHGVQDVSIVEVPGNDFAVIGRIGSGSTKPALMLTHHIDTVPATESGWRFPPLGGERRAGYLTGRGVLDDKSLGVAHAIAMMNLVRSGAGIERDVIFLALPDEEAGGTRGVVHLELKMPELFRNVGLVLGEGGSNVTVVDEVTWWGIEVEQKIPLWIEIVVTARGGHGAGGGAGTAPEILLDILEDLRRLDRPAGISEATLDYLESLASSKVDRSAGILLAAARRPDAGTLEQLPSPQRAVVETSMAVTRLAAGSEDSAPNAIPSEARVMIDFRLPPSADSDAFLRSVEELVGDRGEVRVHLKGQSGSSSSHGGAAWDLIASVLQNHAAAPVGPLVIPGTTDLRLFREKGIEAWGLSPFELNYYDGATIHAENERIRERQFHEGIDVMKDVVLALARSSEW